MPPALDTLCIDSSSPPSTSSSYDKQQGLPPVKDKGQAPYSPCLPFPLSSRRTLHDDHGRCVSTCSMSSAPSLTYSPSPSPPPTRPATPDSFFLVPCAFRMANAIVIVGDQPPTASASSKPTTSSRPTRPIFRPCKPSEARATLLIGPAISTHARKNAAKGERRMHPYRIVRERRGSQ
ncbi:hypothetical protein JB92DRAFT_3125147 [Gautieria morchelliformis]|nr:hypothetical protein JB92DRAFT_3125147 [Gautieria morchelliformis]